MAIKWVHGADTVLRLLGIDDIVCEKRDAVVSLFFFFGSFGRERRQ